eukprot:c8089_g1_i1.p1 GENE.c8089_g1_i1~~c8089_g1_i1.p1  ORF type:complete len:245 (+),score=54.35 c8089_g1_i1:32-736(+)
MTNKSEFSLVYWAGFPGRAEFSRLVFVETGVAWDEYNQTHEVGYGVATKLSGGRAFAVPLLIHGDKVISQSMVMAKYVAKLCDNGRLFPSTFEAEIYADELAFQINDLVAEGEHAWHAISRNDGYLKQKDATQPYIHHFKTNRLGRWLEVFTAQLGDRDYFVGNKLSYIDLAVWFVLDGMEFECAEVFGELRTQGRLAALDKFRERISGREALRKWAETRKERNQEFSATGPTF